MTVTRRALGLVVLGTVWDAVRSVGMMIAALFRVRIWGLLFHVPKTPLLTAGSPSQHVRHCVTNLLDIGIGQIRVDRQCHDPGR
jgi:hypothetical protein